MQFQWSKKVCKKHETWSKMDPKWEPKSIQILQKTRFKNVLTFWINFRRPLVPNLLAKWSPTRRTSSRKPNRKGQLQGKGTPRTVFQSQHARGAGGNPRPGADLSCLRQYSRSGPWKASLHARGSRGIGHAGIGRQFMGSLRLWTKNGDKNFPKGTNRLQKRVKRDRKELTGRPMN